MDKHNDIVFSEVITMGKYPIDISDEDNAKLKYPFLPASQYESVHHYPDGPTVLIRRSKEPLTKEAIAVMVEINQRIAGRRILKEQEEAAANLAVQLASKK